MKLKSVFLSLLTVTVMLAFGSCKPKAEEKPVEKTTIKLSKASIELEEGKSVRLNAILTPRDAKETIAWESSDKAIATVADNGTVKAIKSGQATITAKLTNGNAATCKVTVKAAAAKVDPKPNPDPNQGGGDKPGDKKMIYQLKFEQASYTVVKGQDIQVKAVVTALGDNELPKNIQAKVSYSGGKVMIPGQGEDQLAIVSTNGKVLGVNLGKCKVKAELEGAEPIECEVEVIEPKIQLPAGAKVAFECDDEIITELKFNGTQDNAKWVTVVFVNEANEKIEIEGLDNDAFTYDISKIEDPITKAKHPIATVTFAGWGPNGFAGEGTITATFKNDPKYVGVLKVIVKK